MTIGWDIGGVNTKVARVAGGDVLAALGRPFELQRAPDRLATLLRELAREIGAESPALHAVTMTAELSQMFRTKREGVAFVLDAIETAFPADESRVFAVDNRFLSPAEARLQPLAVAAANWSSASSRGSPLGIRRAPPLPSTTTTPPSWAIRPNTRRR